jgi:hypothetical protein
LIIAVVGSLLRIIDMDGYLWGGILGLYLSEKARKEIKNKVED